MRRVIRGAVACLLLVQVVVIAPRPALALDQTVGDCTETGFDAALSAVHASGGGIITFDCTGTVLFTGAKKIDSDVTIVGNGNVIFGGNGSTHLFDVGSGASLELVNLTLRDGNTTFGGAIRNSGTLTIIASTFIDNNATTGGGAIVNLLGGTLSITASTFRENTAAPYGGAIINSGTLLITGSSFDNNSATIGGGAIYSGLGMLTLSTSTFNNNTASGGGAILNSSNAMTVTASTFSGNSASTSNGGAIVNTGTLTITAGTFIGNTAAVRSGAIENFGALTITASIVALNSATNSNPNCFGSLTSGGSNLSDDDSCSFTADGDIVSSAIDLEALANNGGPTRTMRPLNGSAAIGNAVCEDTTDADQRGYVRPDTGCEIGAVELGLAPVQLITALDVRGDEGDSVPLVAVGAGPPLLLAYVFDCDATAGYETPGSLSTPLGDASASVSLATCTFPDDGVYSVGVRVCMFLLPDICGTGSLEVDVANVAPAIHGITTDAPVQAGQPVTITVTASDPAGDNDPLTYAFDCNDDDIYETVGESNQGQCLLSPDQATATIGVQVSDDDGGVTTDAVEVSQTATLCGSRYTGALSAPAANGSCPPGSAALTLPGPAATTLCINLYTGAITWSSRGTCGAGYRAHIVPDDGPLYYCRSLYTGTLRYSATGTCSAHERPGVIPG